MQTGCVKPDGLKAVASPRLSGLTGAFLGIPLWVVTVLASSWACQLTLQLGQVPCAARGTRVILIHVSFRKKSASNYFPFTCILTALLKQEAFSYVFSAKPPTKLPAAGPKQSHNTGGGRDLSHSWHYFGKHTTPA